LTRQQRIQTLTYFGSENLSVENFQEWRELMGFDIPGLEELKAWLPPPGTSPDAPEVFLLKSDPALQFLRNLSAQVGYDASLVDQARYKRVLKAHSVILNSVEDRTFFITSSGHVGMAYLVVNEKDLVVMITGADVPMIVRPAGSYYQLIAPAYIHGMMNDGLRLRESGQLIEQEFQII
jgi:hypothetical protein